MGTGTAAQTLEESDADSGGEIQATDLSADGDMIAGAGKAVKKLGRESPGL